MDFLYQAIKRATGTKPEASEQTAVEMLLDEKVSAAELQDVLPAALKMVSTVPVMSDRAKTLGKARKSFEVKHPLDYLVAFLSHPVLEPNVVAMEQCKVLRARLREIIHAKKVRSILVTSAMQGEGKTLLSVNLAYALSQIEGMKVLLVDADLRRPNIATFLKMGKTEGLNKYLLEQREFDDVCWKITPSLYVVPTGEVRSDSAELLHGSRMVKFLAEATANFNIVLFDGPPMFPIVDAQVLSHLVDGALMVVRSHQTPFDLARQAADLLKSKLIGTILNGVDRLPANHYYSSYLGKPKKK